MHKNRQQYQSGQYKMQTADCRLQTFFPILITKNAQVFLSYNYPKIRENLFHKSWKFA